MPSAAPMPSLKRELETELKQNSELFWKLEAHASDGFFFWDLTDTTRGWFSPRFYTLIGFPEESTNASPKRWMERIFPEDRERARENYLRHVDTAEHPYDQVVRFLHQDGSTVWIRVRGWITRDKEGQPLRMLGSHTDLTAQKQAEARASAAQQLNTVGRMAASVMHEINNPLTYILVAMREASGFAIKVRELVRTLFKKGRPRPLSPDWEEVAAILDDSGIQDELDAFAENLEHCSQALSKISGVSRSMQSLSKVKLGQVRAVDIHEPIKTACRITENALRHRATLQLDLEPVPLLVADATQLYQVATNLVMNAIEATPTDEPGVHTIRVFCRCQGGFVVFGVADTGAGMSEQVLERAFDAFFTTKDHPSNPGQGLGLALCKEIARLHGGDLGLESTPGQGTTATVRIPLDTGLELDSVDIAPVSPVGRRSILIVDDDALIRRAMTKLLNDRYELVIAGSAAEAIAELEEGHDFDVILCDLMMPHGGGSSLYETIEERWPQLISRVVICTGGAMAPREEDLLRDAPGPVLHKPFTAHELFQVIDEVAP